MNLLRALRTRLGWRLMLSYVGIVLVTGIVLAGTAELLAPSALSRHIARMDEISEGDVSLAQDVHTTFQAAMTETLVVAGVAAAAAAVVVGLFTARRIVGPIEAMARASRSIADGDYRQRVAVDTEDELGNLARAFNRMAGALEQTELRRTTLIGDVAHELRTPLANIQSIAEGLVDGVLPNAQATFQQIQRESTRLQRLTDDLQELSRAEAGQIRLDRRSVAPVSLIGSATGRLAAQFAEKGVALAVDLPSGLPEILADGNRMTQVLTNILGNALQFTPSGGRVSVTAWLDGAALMIEITDNGLGLAAADVERIFERFYRVDRSRSRSGGGTGIGLAIARHLVEAHGGRIWAESPGLGQGSAFFMSLPLQE